MGASSSQGADDTNETRLEGVEIDDPVWKEVADLVSERSKPYMQHYKSRYHVNGLRVRKLWRVKPGGKLQEREALAATLGKPTRLFHGTSPANVAAICKGGFSLPQHPGMFGKGVYFADCPQKSANYSKENSVFPALWRCITLGLRKAAEAPGGQMLLCDVYLGRSMTKRCPKSDLGAKDLEPGWFQKLFGHGPYDSVTAPGGFFSAVNVPEFIVYQEHQGVPRFVIEFEFER